MCMYVRVYVRQGYLCASARTHAIVCVCVCVGGGGGGRLVYERSRAHGVCSHRITSKRVEDRIRIIPLICKNAYDKIPQEFLTRTSAGKAGSVLTKRKHINNK